MELLIKNKSCFWDSRVQVKLLREADPSLERSASITKRSLLSTQTSTTHVTGPPKLSGEEGVVPSNISGIKRAQYAAQSTTQKGCLQSLYKPRREAQAITITYCPQWALLDVPVLTPSISLKQPPSSSSKGLTFFTQHMLNMWETGLPKQSHRAYPLAKHDCPQQTLSDRENTELAGR